MCSRTPLSLVGARPRGRTRTGVGVSCSPAVSDGTCEAACACRVMRARHSSANSEVVSCTDAWARAHIPRTHTTRATRGSPVVAKPHFPWTKIVISSDEKRRSSRSLPGPFAAEQPTDASYLSRVVRCAPASDEAPRGPNWQSINRRTRRPKFHDERPATPRCLLALPTEASSFP